MSNISVVDRPSIVEMYNSGMSGSAIAKETGIPVTTVYDRLLAYGVKMRKRGQRAGMGDRLDHKEVTKTVLLYRNGYSSNQVAAMLGITHTAVTYRLRMAGEPIRTRSESVRMRKRIEEMDKAKCIAELYAEGFSLREMSRRFGMSRPAIKMRIVMAGGEIRSEQRQRVVAPDGR